MARDTRARFLEALKKQDERIYNAFMETLAMIRNSADLARLDRALETQDVEAVMQALNLTEAGLSEVETAIQEAFNGGAEYQNAAAPKDFATELRLSFYGSHPRVLEWMRQNSAALVAEVLEDQRDVIRDTIQRGTTERIGYRKIALELVGRMDGNQRKGGVVGLLAREAAYVRGRIREDGTMQRGALQELQDLDAAYFRRKLRDRRFDKAIRAAIDEGRPLPAKLIENATARYSARLLRERGRRISRTEGNKAMNAGRAEAMVQAIESGKIPAFAVTIIWDATPGPRTRDSHRALNGMQVKWGEVFVSPVTMAVLKWPHDEDADAAETVNCRCSARFRVDYVAVRNWRDRQRARAA